MIIDLSRVSHFLRPLAFVWRTSNRALTVTATVIALLLFFNETLAEQTRGVIQAVSPYWALMPIALLLIWAFYARVLDLEERLRPKLEICFNRDPFYMREISETDPDSAVSETPALRSLQLMTVGIRNTSARWIEGISVRLVDLHDAEGRRRVGQVPTWLWRPDAGPAAATQPGASPFPLRPAEEKIIHLARFCPATAQGPIEILLWDGSRVPIDATASYELKIGVFAPDIQAGSSRFKLWVDGEGRLQLEQLEDSAEDSRR